MWDLTYRKYPKLMLYQCFLQGNFSLTKTQNSLLSFHLLCHATAACVVKQYLEKDRSVGDVCFIYFNTAFCEKLRKVTFFILRLHKLFLQITQAWFICCDLGLLQDVWSVRQRKATKMFWSVIDYSDGGELQNIVTWNKKRTLPSRGMKISVTCL